MLNFFRNLIRLPKNLKEDEVRTGNILRNIVMIFFVLPVIIFALIPFFPNSSTILLRIGSSALLLIIILIFTLRRGQIHIASFIFIFGLLILAIFVNYHFGGVFNGTFVIIGTIIFLSGLLLGTKWAVITLFVLIIEEAVLGWAGINGMVKAQGEIVYPATNYIITFTSYVISLVIFQTSQSSLSKQLEISRVREQKIQALTENLELRIQQRTLELDKRSIQLEAASLIARTIAEIHGQKEILETIVEQITERFNFYHTGIFLVDTNKEFVILEAASSEGGKRMIKHGHKLAIGRQGIVGLAAYQKRPRIAQNVGTDAIFFNNPDLPETHSEMALPLLARNRLVGILDIQSKDDNAFSTEDVSTLQIMADQIALAIENARLLNESRSAIDELQTITTENISGTWKERLGQFRKGYTYSSSGISAISPASEENKNNDSKIDNSHIIKIPVALRGQRIGQLSLLRKFNESPWTEAEQEMADKIAIQVALAIENARLLEESQRRALREQTVNDLSSRFSRSLDVDTLLQNAVRELHLIPQVSEVSIYISPDEATENQNRNTEGK
jgi:GAF domain-containing protein